MSEFLDLPDTAAGRAIEQIVAALAGEGRHGRACAARLVRIGAQALARIAGPEAASSHLISVSAELLRGRGCGVGRKTGVSVYVAIVRARSEFAAVEDLRRGGVTAYAPAATIWRRTPGGCRPELNPILPKYVFIWSANIARDLEVIHSERYGRRISKLVDCNGKPLVLGGDWLAKVWLAQVFGVLDETRPRKGRWKRPFTLGQTVRLLVDPFRGLIATLEAVGDNNVRVRLHAQSPFSTVSLDVDMLEAA